LPCRAAVIAAYCRYHCGEKKRKSTVLYNFILFCFGNDDREFDGEGKGNGNNNGNSYGDDWLLSVLWQW
jgi:hypothetical protein